MERQVKPITAIESRPIGADEREDAIAFLKSQGYARTIGENDRFFISETAGEIVGIVRLAREDGVLVLRGMRVRKDFQRRGVGIQLLRRLVQDAWSERCYCIPYRWLIPFYGQVGFREVAANEAPAFLAKRHASYVSDGLAVVIMCRFPE
jgi:N-acetylglutamate synthase-like GNAT family acetyltransferase